ncbi:beta-amyrin 28-monooxygenase [Cajanus cajan]|uniref:Cytochrome P450 716B2 family n=1 Tax=Cajanus cajan TaxID=3821 RepID=A0A151R4R6_CAJCA|nr:beta-amyrin 28-monooxygenase [Cajanus cajan]KYP37604.1 Cytochrome P450 716B2 family [Cajanus cajan]
MDFFMQTLFLTLITLVASIYVWQKRKTLGGTKTLPPGTFGWPLVGETFQFLFNKVDDFLQERAKKYSSEIFCTNILGEPTVVLCGPGANKFVSTNETKLVKVWYMKTQRRFFNIPDHTHAAKPKQQGASAAPVAILGILKPEGMSSYMGNKIGSIMHQHFLTHWEGKTEVEVYPLVKDFSFRLVCQFYLGLDEPKLATEFENLYFGIYSVPLNFPGSKYSRALRAAAAIRKEIQFLIKEKIDALNKGQVVDGLLGHVVGAEQGGNYVPRLEISNIIMGLMNSSHLPIAITLAFMIKHIGQRPDIYQKIISEHADITKSKGSGTALDWDSIQKLKYTWAVAQETMRLYPTAPGAFREALTDITYEGFTIPKGWKIYWSLIGINKNPKYFPEPESFDPSRFEGNVHAPYTWIPFGAGPRSCPGRDYTRFVLINFIHILITKFKWEAIFSHEKVSGSLVPIPAEGIPIRLHHL